MRPKTGLSWWGGSRPEREGGMVTSVGLNAARPALAVDFDAPAPPPPSRRRGPSLSEGARVDVRRMGEAPDETTRPSGRFKLPKG